MDGRAEDDGSSRIRQAAWEQSIFKERLRRALSVGQCWQLSIAVVSNVVKDLPGPGLRSVHRTGRVGGSDPRHCAESAHSPAEDAHH